MRRKAAARAFLENAARVAATGVRRLSERQIRAEIDSVRRAPRPACGARSLIPTSLYPRFCGAAPHTASSA